MEPDKNQDKESDSLNPGQTDYDNKFNGLAKAEKDGTINDAKPTKEEKTSDKESESTKIKDKEEDQPGNWKDRFSGSKNNSKSKNKFSGFKKKGPMTTIILTLVGGGIGIGGLLSPGLLLVNLKEVMVNKFNAQLASMDRLTIETYKSKLTGGVGICGSTVSIRCKYSSMSDRQMKRFANAGITVEVDPDGKNLIGRNRVTGLTMEGRTIKASGLIDELNKNPKFRASVKKAYNPLFAGFADKIWNKTLFKFRITEKGIVIEGNTDAEKARSIQEDTKNPAISSEDIDVNNKKPSPDNYKNADGSLREAEFNNATKNFNDAVAASKKLASEAANIAEEVAGTGLKAATKAGASLAKNTLSLTGAVDNICTVYGTLRAVGFAAKTVRVLQLARYAMLFLKIADQIKAGGNPNPVDVTYLAGILTRDVVGTIKRKTATESFGYRFAAFGERGKMPSTAMQFLAGGGLAGDMIALTTVFDSVLGEFPHKTCRLVNNMLFQFASVTGGIVLAVFSAGATVTLGAVVQGVLTTAVGVATIFLPALLKDIVAGVAVDSDTVGDPAGNAITSGASGLQGEAAMLGGNSPLTPQQAVPYQALSESTIAQYNEEDRLSRSPFDVTSKNTFLGNLLFKLTPTISKASSISGVLTSIASILPTSLKLISPITKAADIGDFTYCADEDYKSMNIATDPFCNISYGIPKEDLSIGPITVIDNMIQNGDIDENGNIKDGPYKYFTEQCGAARTDPLGYTGTSFDGDKGEICMNNETNKMNKYYYLYQIYQRVEAGMDGSDEALNLAEEANGGMNADISFYNSSLGTYAVGSNQPEVNDSAYIEDINITENPTNQEDNSNTINFNNQTTTQNKTLDKDKSDRSNNNFICKMSDINNQITDINYLCGKTNLIINRVYAL